MIIDVTDESFEQDVLVRSEQVPVVVDLWAPWCGPCKTLSPIIEKVVAETGGNVVLAKINVDENPRASATFQVQGIPAVYALAERRIVNGFVGAQGEQFVREFVASLLPTEEETVVSRLIAAGDEASLRQVLELEPGNEEAVTGLADLLVEDGKGEEALQLLERIPESAETRRIAALARTGGGVPEDDIGPRLDALLDRVKADETARQEFVDLLEVLGPDDPRTPHYRKQLTSRLF
ncbi:MAG: tetratricopeptide repeat protein [Acidimicrobiia bacterium]|nr:tetratricopeptide repeat protein [Acidimicrobiia bacterium]